MAGALQSVTGRVDVGIGPEPRELDLAALLRALPEPEPPAGLEDRLRVLLYGDRGWVGH
jgi:hypothetical protein